MYDLSRFAMFHPGGAPPLLEVAGQEATDEFYGLHRRSVLEVRSGHALASWCSVCMQEPKYSKLKIGRVADAGPREAAQVDSHARGEAPA